MKIPIHKKPVLERIEFYDYKEPFRSIFINYRKGNINKEEGLRLFLKEVKKRKPLYEEINKRNYKEIFEILSRGAYYTKKTPSETKYASAEALGRIAYDGRGIRGGFLSVIVVEPSEMSHKEVINEIEAMSRELEQQYSIEKFGIDSVGYRILLKNPQYIWDESKVVI